MANKHFLRGMATLNFWADDVVAARDWYAEHPAYIEFRIGDAEDEFGIIDRKYAPKGMQPGPGGAILLWHVDDIEAAFERLKALGAQEFEPNTKRGDSGFVTASAVDPFGNILGSCTTRTTSKCSIRTRNEGVHGDERTAGPALRIGPGMGSVVGRAPRPG